MLIYIKIKTCSYRLISTNKILYNYEVIPFYLLIFIIIAPTIDSNKTNEDIISHIEKLVYNIFPILIISCVSAMEPSHEFEITYVIVS